MDDEIRLLQLIAGQWAARSLYVAVELGIFDFLASGPRSTAALSELCSARADLLDRILGALCQFDLVARVERNVYKLTSCGELLTADSPSAMRAWTLLWGKEFEAAWHALPEAVASDRNAFELAHGVPIFQHIGSNPTMAALFHQAMAGLARYNASAVASQYNFNQHATLVDIGGGNGALLGEILKIHAQPRAILFDRTSAFEQLDANFQRHVETGRATTAAGDFFVEVPKGADCYVLSNILHDWNEEQCRAILLRIREAIADGGRLILVEMALSEPGSEPALARMTDLNMLVLTGGRERTHDQFASLLQSSGFTLLSSCCAGDATCLLTAVPVQGIENAT